MLLLYSRGCSASRIKQKNFLDCQNGSRHAPIFSVASSKKWTFLLGESPKHPPLNLAAKGVAVEKFQNGFLGATKAF